MFDLIKWEIKKNLRPGVIVAWVIGLMLGFNMVFTNFGIEETYAVIFSKYYGIVPIMGIIMFTMFSGSFVLEYSSNTYGLIKASKNGKNKLVLAKFIANGISASIINLSILMVMVGRAIVVFKFDGLDLPLKSLWYFGNSGSDITIGQMLIIVSLTVILGSFLFAAIGIYLSSLCKIKGGKRIPRGRTFSKERTPHIYIRVSDMKNNTIITTDLKYIDDDVYQTIKNYTISSSDLYLTIAGTIGHVGIVPKQFDGMNLTENAAKLTGIICDKKYLLYSLLSSTAQEHFKSRFHQVAQPKLSIETASSTMIYLPPLKEQHRIVSQIEEIFAQLDTIEASL